MKILYFVNGLNYKGGIARIVVDKANYLADKFKHDVTICVANNIVESAYPLSHNVKICKFDSENRLDTGLLKKISSSKYKDKFIIKGGFLLSSIFGVNLRSTMDLDTTIKGLALNRDVIKKIWMNYGKSSK